MISKGEKFKWTIAAFPFLPLLLSFLWALQENLLPWGIQDLVHLPGWLVKGQLLSHPIHLLQYIVPPREPGPLVVLGIDSEAQQLKILIARRDSDGWVAGRNDEHRAA
ncbi:hypothetical protein T4B_1128 [Trichinella pseudospiralis]|uniref:Uncharacterized protein n=2 Tax=Trichinella TaxID=6333 RepID=A0A0V1GJL1_TRIPS|nr:hypothetical protein T4A_1624 [Trichinella pseudospiralis]KRY98210.1 hypothetical protein T4B_1128 [Trichinella pseudospiralis]KRZ65044.1 hypothetical protein T10_10822 [Trichinella papuae]